MCTIEKANALVLRLLEGENMGLLSMLIVDELHMVRAHACLTALGNRSQSTCSMPTMSEPGAHVHEGQKFVSSSIF